MQRIRANMEMRMVIEEDKLLTRTKCSPRRRRGLGKLATCILLALATAVGGGGHLAASAKLPEIYWNASNPIFRIDNTDHIFDVNKKQHEHDQVDLVCPEVGRQQSNGSAPAPDQQERYIIYSVSKEEYETCRVNGPGRIVALCDGPQPNGKPRLPITITFRSYTPQPNGFEYKSGHDYHFITSLVGHHQDPQRRFAPCREQNMRVIFKVCCKSQQPVPLPPPSAPRPAPDAGRRTASQPAKRPPVITYKPVVVKPPVADEFLFPETPKSAQQQQPVTVLPIEVLPAEEAGSSPPPSSTSASNDSNSNSSSGNSNDMPQNEQASSPGPPSQELVRPPPPPAPFIPFDPTSPPERLLPPQWSPTPLPHGLTHPKSRPAAQAANKLWQPAPVTWQPAPPELWSPSGLQTAQHHGANFGRHVYYGHKPHPGPITAPESASPAATPPRPDPLLAALAALLQLLWLALAPPNNGLR